jgi:hypothetical protein
MNTSQEASRASLVEESMEMESTCIQMCHIIDSASGLTMSLTASSKISRIQIISEQRENRCHTSLNMSRRL